MAEKPYSVAEQSTPKNERYETREEALREFQRAVALGHWCEVWHTFGTDNNSGIKIADFPGVQPAS